ncbi:hypothetical protein C8Q79DRAFT_146232 [Trametes meyenii]|nr:hypothetical protein C8Q79DRAFT_146232 [Trametes meyenii]
MPCSWSTTASFLWRSVEAKLRLPTRTKSCYPSQVTPRTGLHTSSREGYLNRLREHHGLVVPTQQDNVHLSASLAVSPFLFSTARSLIHAPTRSQAGFYTSRLTTRYREPLYRHEARTYSTAPYLRAETVQTSSSEASSIRSTSAQLSSAQVSRASAQAVRLCIREGNYGDALYVVNSACQSVLQGPLDPSRQKSKLEPIQFGCAVSPRLAAHAFLHGLIRGGYHSKASTYAKLMIRAGIPIRPRTLETVVSSLATSSTLPKFGPFARIVPRKPSFDNPSVVQLRTTRVADLCARAALDLLQEARAFGQQRTERMYRVMIETLLMQGEILVASLLFVLLLKDYEVRLREVVTNEEPGGKDYITHGHLNVALPPRVALFNAPYPNPKIMGKILDTIDANRELGTSSATSQSVQSLAIFAMLLDTGQIAQSRVSSLVSSLYRYPDTAAYVWILRNGELVRVGAYQYFHEVLQRLIDSMSAKDPPRPTPRLNGRTYNSLLSYALRHRLSPEMASTVLHHMCVVRDPPVVPSVVTYNILLRSGTLLRKMDICDKALAVLRAGASGFDAETAVSTLVPSSQESESAATGSTGLFEAQRSSLEGEGRSTESREAVTCEPESVNVDHTPTTPSATKLKPDRYTLSSFVNYLAATGQPHAVAAMVFKLLPELVVVDHPAAGVVIPESIPKRLNREKAMKRAVARGPYVYASVINALAKAREVGLAERVFILAQQAERASHVPGFVPSVPPWRLTVHAYTALLQCYSAVVHQELPRGKLDPRYLGTTVLQPHEANWRPKARHHHHGYARFVHMMNEQDRQRRVKTKPQMSRRNAMLLYRSLMSGGRALLGSLVRNSKVRPVQSTLPGKTSPEYTVKPDARFFNAALKLFAPRPKRVSKRRRSDAYWHHRMEHVVRRHTRSGTIPHQWSPMLDKIARAMVASGFDVPVGYRHLLVMKWGQGSFCARRPRRTHMYSPYAFPGARNPGRSPFKLPTFKTRGLPVRRLRYKGRATKMRVMATAPKAHVTPSGT